MRRHPIDALGELMIGAIVFGLGIGGIIGIVFAACVLSLRVLELLIGPTGY